MDVDVNIINMLTSTSMEGTILPRERGTPWSWLISAAFPPQRSIRIIEHSKEKMKVRQWQSDYRSGCDGIFGIPRNRAPIAAWCRTGILERRGIDIPTT
ncbi:hypothetical protein [Bifidobacterium eulemuris]|nr:hypothetical protein [Bifidobacterium eulemuris]